MKKNFLFFILAFVICFMPVLIFAEGINPLPDTGQDKCYDNSGEIPCPAPGEDFYGQDAQYQGLQQSFEKKEINGDLVVIDKNTGLMWQQGTVDINGDGEINYNDEVTWDNAKDYCETLTYAGYDDWRLPTIFELTTIVNYGEYNPAIDESYFSSKSAYYWSATTNAYNTDSAWVVSFYYGNGYDWHESYYDGYIRCVRGGVLKIGSFKALTISGDNVVKDTATGLMWQQGTGDTNGDSHITYNDKLNWKKALSYCENLSYAGCTDWRLPNIQELRSIVKYNTYSPAIDTSYFSSEPASYWSATTDADYTYNAGEINFSYGYDHYWDKSNYYYVRCVRGGLIDNSNNLCDFDHLCNCNNEADCNDAGGYWYNSVCNAEPEVACDSDHLDLCTTESECNSIGKYWYNNKCNSSPETYTLTVKSSGTGSVSITSSSSTYSGTTNYSKTGISKGTSITLYAPSSKGDYKFTSWSGCSYSSGTTCYINSISSDKTVTAYYQYQTPTYSLTVKSSGVSGVYISSSSYSYRGTTNYTKTGITKGQI